MYSQDDVRRLIDQTAAVVRASVAKEFDEFARVNSMFLRHLFLQAEGNEIQLRVDPNVIHDESLMGAGKPMDKKAGDLPSASAGASKLAPIHGAVDVNLVAKMKEMEASGKRTQDRFVKLQQQYLELQKKSNEMREKLEHAEHARSSTEADFLAAVSDSNSARSSQAALSSHSAAAAAEIAELRAKVGALETEVATRVMQTRQFQDLKKMVMKKNQQIKDIRSRLERYEPASSGGGDAAGGDDEDSD